MTFATTTVRYPLNGPRPVGLVFDAGTGGVRGACFDLRTGEWIGAPAESAYAPVVTEDDPPHVVLDPEAGTKATIEVISTLLTSTPELRGSKLHAVYFGGHMHAPFCVDGGGKVCFPVHMWNSAAAREDAARIRQTVGWNVPDRVTVSHLVRFSRLDLPHLRDDVQLVTTQAGYLAWLMSGRERCGLDPCEFSGLGLNQPKDSSLSAELLQLFPFPLRPKLPLLLRPLSFTERSLSQHGTVRERDADRRRAACEGRRGAWSEWHAARRL